MVRKHALNVPGLAAEPLIIKIGENVARISPELLRCIQACRGPRLRRRGTGWPTTMKRQTTGWSGTPSLWIYL